MREYIAVENEGEASTNFFISVGHVTQLAIYPSIRSLPFPSPVLICPFKIPFVCNNRNIFHQDWIHLVLIPA